MSRLFAWVLLLSLSLAQSPQSTETKIVIRRVFGRHSSEQVIYRTADKRRTEFRNFVRQKGSDGSVEWVLEREMVMIQRCDLGESFVLKLKTAEYTSAAPLSLPRQKSLPCAESQSLKRPNLTGLRFKLKPLPWTRVNEDRCLGAPRGARLPRRSRLPSKALSSNSKKRLPMAGIST